MWLPEHLVPGFRDFALKFYWECFKVGKNILRALAVGLGLPEDHLVNYHSGHNNQLRFLHYPPIYLAALESDHFDRMPTHTDWSSITMVFQDDSGGLEVEMQDGSGQFMPVTPVKGSLVMNVGDLLQRWSNGISLPLSSTFLIHVFSMLTYLGRLSSLHEAPRQRAPKRGRNSRQGRDQRFARAPIALLDPVLPRARPGFADRVSAGLHRPRPPAALLPCHAACV